MNLTVYVVVGNLFLFLVFIFWKNFMSAKFIFMYKLLKIRIRLSPVSICVYLSCCTAFMFADK